MKQRTFFFRPAARPVVFWLVLGLLLCPAFSPVTALAEDIIWDGNPPPFLQNIPMPWGAINDSIAPSGSDSGKSASVSGNRVTINAPVTGGVFGALTNDSDAVTNNSVVINDTVGSDVFGGVTFSIGSDDVTATGNSVTVNNGILGGTVYGGYAESNTASATATGNSVTISGGTVTGDVHGGAAFTDLDATATGNSVTISGGTVNGNVFSAGLPIATPAVPRPRTIPSRSPARRT